MVSGTVVEWCWPRLSRIALTTVSGTVVEWRWLVLSGAGEVSSMSADYGKRFRG